MTKTILLIILFMQLGFAQTKTYLTTEVNTLKSKNTMSLSMADVVVDSFYFYRTGKQITVDSKKEKK